MTVIYILEGKQITSLESFWQVIGEAVNGKDGYFGKNLDALNDCLRGGFGTPANDDFTFEWRDHEISRANLGYDETVRQLEKRLVRCHPSNRASVQADIDLARSHAGQTVFDWLVDIITDADPNRLILQ